MPAYEDWLIDIGRQHPTLDIVPTQYGCAAYEGDEIIAEYDYESNTCSEQMTRY